MSLSCERTAEEDEFLEERNQHPLIGNIDKFWESFKENKGEVKICYCAQYLECLNSIKGLRKAICLIEDEINKKLQLIDQYKENKNHK